MSSESYARSAAAFAVVAVRRGLPLESVDTFYTIAPVNLGPGEDERPAVAGSCAKLVDGEAEAWVDALPDPAAVAKLTDLATMAAALCVSESREGRMPGDGIGQGDAIYTMYIIAEGLDFEDREERNRWLIQRLLDAHAILVQDGEAAWVRVRLELEKRGYLTGEEVRALIAESDSMLGPEVSSQ